MTDSPDSLRALDAEFELGESLGQGAMGSVFRARERASGREVALKVLRGETSSAASRFLREGQVTAALQHPGIVRIHSIGTLRGRPCLAYELVPEARSFERAAREDPQAAIPLLIQAGRALGAAHAAGLTHRDVKSENLLVDAEGRLRVTDFGLATGEELDRLTRSGAWVGTPQTMAPEQFGDREATGPSSDVWSLGVLLYWALCGRYPFAEAESMIALASAITAGDFQPPSAFGPVPPELEAVCLRALRARPEERYPDGAAFAAALAACASEAATPPQKRALLAPLLGLGLLIALGLWLGLGAPQTDSAARPSVTLSAPAGREPSPAPSAPSSPAAKTFLSRVVDWKPRQKRPIPPAVLDHPYAEVESSFEHILYGLREGYGPKNELRAARALLSGTGVARDVTPALEILRHLAHSQTHRGPMVLLIETLAAEGLRDEELLWIGRLAHHDPRPFELHRLWRIAHDREPRSARAAAIWEVIPPAKMRRAALMSLHGGARRRVDDLRAEGPERTRFLIEALLAGWRRSPSLWSDWELSVGLDCLSPADQVLLVERGSPSRSLARLCLRREDRAELLEVAIAPTLSEAEEPWLLEVLEELVRLQIKPPALAAILRRLQGSSSPAARRLVATCEAAGFGLPASTRGLEALQRLHAAGDYEAGLILLAGRQRTATPTERGLLLRPGVSARHPGSLLAWAGLLLASPDAGQRRAGLKALRRAAEADHVPALVGYAELLRRSARTQAELREVYELVVRAARQEDPTALELRGIYLRAGIGCAKDPVEARHCLRLAAWKGRASAALRFGTLLLRPLPDEDSYRRGVRLTQAHEFFVRAVHLTGSLAARRGVALARLQAPQGAEEGLRALAKLASEDPKSEAAIDYGIQLLASGDEEGKEVLERAAGERVRALTALVAHWRATRHSGRAKSVLATGVAARQPTALIVSARERFAEDPGWSERTLSELGPSRPEALTVLGELLWEAGQEKRAAELWLEAQLAGDPGAVDALAEHDWQEAVRAR